MERTVEYASPGTTRGTLRGHRGPARGPLPLLHRPSSDTSPLRFSARSSCTIMKPDHKKPWPELQYKVAPADAESGKAGKAEERKPSLAASDIACGKSGESDRIRSSGSELGPR